MPPQVDGLADSITSQAAILTELVSAYFEANLKSTGLTLGAFELLSAVKAAPSATQAEIAGRLGITPSSLCEAIRSAQNKGFVEQEISATDRRARQIVLTRKGAKALENALETLRRAELAATQSLPVARLSTAVEALRAAARNLSAEIASQS